ncbi:MAG: M23 family metallopeptidase [Clostridiales bacterium]|nr:M23 family metallopeptidase [Clostridiales bacterium]
MKLSKMQQLILIELFLFILLLGAYTEHHTKDASDILSTSSNEVYRLISEEETISSNSENKDYIKWVDFKVTKEAMQDAYEYDVTTYGQETHLDWISLLAYQACKNGGNFSHYRSGDISLIAKKLLAKETTLGALTKDLKYYTYYYEAYSAVLGGLVGEYEVPATSETPSDNAVSEDDTVSSDDTASPNTTTAKKNSSAKKDSHIIWEKKYGLKGFLPLAKNFPYSDYDDFGVSRSYGYKRQHLGHDMMGQTGTPIIAVESGYVEAIGWNQYGGWRLGIRSFDGKRYYYYAHLRQNFPYCKSLTEGSVVTAGDVIGYLGHTGYSTKENVNNIDIPHLHFGLQLIFDESQKEGNNEIWVSCYELTRFLYQNQSETVKDENTKEWHRITEMRDPAVKEWKKAHKN